MAIASESLSIADARALFAPETTYLNTATYGLPPRTALDAMEAAIGEWRGGRGEIDRWDAAVGEARAAFARLHGVAVEDVAVGPQVSPLVAVVAASLPRGARVVCAEEDFTSLLFPLLVQRQRDVRVDCVPLDRVAEAIDGGTHLAAVSAVQSADGRVADLDAIATAARHHNAQTLIDATHACGWLPLDAGRFDYVACGGYKWLLNPRGTAFLSVRPERRAELIPHAASWYAGEVPMDCIYGPPLRLSDDARRFDISPAWLSWVGAAPALQLFEQVGVDAIHAHDLALANRFRAGLGLAASDSAIASVDLAAEAAERLRAAGVVSAGRDGRTRFSFHLYTTEADVDRALDVLQG